MNKITKITLFTILIGFFSPVFSQTIIEQDGKFGLTDKNGKVIIKPILDSIFIRLKKWRGTIPLKFYILKNKNKLGFAISTIDEGWKVSEIKFDNIFHKSIGFIITTIDAKYGFISYDPIRGIGILGETMDFVEFAENLFISKLMYDNISDRKGGYMYIFKNGKYGLVINSDRIIPANFDTIPKFITNYNNYDKKYFAGEHKFYSIVQDGYYGIYQLSILWKKKSYLNNYLYNNSNFIKKDWYSKTCLPLIYKKNEIGHFTSYFNVINVHNEVFEAPEVRFVINQKGKPIRIFNPKDSTFLVLKEKGKPIIATISGENCRIDAGNTDSYYYTYDSVTKKYDKEVELNKLHIYRVRDKNKSGQLIYYNKITGEAVTYTRPNCNYKMEADVKSFVTEYDYSDTNNIKITFYTLFEKRKIFSLELDDFYYTHELEVIKKIERKVLYYRLFGKLSWRDRQSIGYIDNRTLMYKKYRWCLWF